MNAGKKNLQDNIQRTHHWKKRDLNWWMDRGLEFVIMGGAILMIILLMELLEVLSFEVV
jgi:hypothetical protein